MLFTIWLKYIQYTTFNTMHFFQFIIIFFVNSCEKGEPSQLDLDNVVVPGLNSFNGDEAAMAVIMSLLETDTNMGQSVDFEDLHWPF